MLEYAQKMLSWRMEHDERTLTRFFLTPAGVVERRRDASGMSKPQSARLRRGPFADILHFCYKAWTGAAPHVVWWQRSSPTLPAGGRRGLEFGHFWQ